MKKIVVLLLILAMLPLSAFAKFENTHTNTGNPLEDIIAVATTQLGYMEGDLSGEVDGSNDCTKYGEWYGLNYNPWCAMFVSWCADQAGIPTSIIPKHASCDVGMDWFEGRGRFAYSPAYGGSYTPKRGDIVYFGEKYGTYFDSTHVGIVHKVDSEKIYVLEGNSSRKVQEVSYKQDTDYILGYGRPDYSLESSQLAPGRYVTTADTLNFRAEPNTSCDIIGKIPRGTSLDITEIANTKWGKTVYGGKSGWVSLDYCVPGGFGIIYNANGGSNCPEAGIKLPGETYVITNEIPTREGYSFSGWSTTSSGKVKYSPGASYTLDAAITLYAVWTADSYTVQYDANGGQGAPASQTKKHDVPLILSELIPTRQGFNFLGWSRVKNAEAEYSPKDSYTVNRSVTLYAVWEMDKKEFKITYNANNGTNPPAPTVFSEGDGAVLTTSKPTRSGYRFEGWAYESNAPWAELFGGEKFTDNRSVTLYAVWTKNVSGLKLNSGSGGRILTRLSDNTLTLKILADKGNSISCITLDSKALGLVGDLCEYTLTLDVAAHSVDVEFTCNEGLWINPFADVSNSAWYYKAVEYCYTENIMTGMDESHFSPNTNVTRAQFVTLLGRLHGVAPESGELPFSDVSKNGYYYGYLCWAYSNKLVSGTSATTFAPNTSVTREQLCVMLYNYVKYTGVDTSGVNSAFICDFSDYQTVSPWAEQGVCWAVYEKYLSGIAGQLQPRSNATRAQAAQMIYTVLN